MKTTTTLPDITSIVCKVYGVNVGNLKSKSRKRQFVIPRQLCMYLARKYTYESFDSIGDFYNRNHATVIFSVAKWDGWVKNPKAYLKDEDLENLNKIEFYIENNIENNYFMMFALAGPILDKLSRDIDFVKYLRDGR